MRRSTSADRPWRAGCAPHFPGKGSTLNDLCYRANASTRFCGIPVDSGFFREYTHRSGMRHVPLAAWGGSNNRRSAGGSEWVSGWRTWFSLGGPGRAGASLISGVSGTESGAQSFRRWCPDSTADGDLAAAQLSSRLLSLAYPATPGAVEVLDEIIQSATVGMQRDREESIRQKCSRIA